MVSDTGWLSPSTNGTTDAGGLNGANAYTSNNLDFNTQNGGAKHDFGGFGINIPGGSIIFGIEVSVEGAEQFAGENVVINFELSGDGTTSYTSSGNTVQFTETFDETKTMGGAADTWGESWTTTMLNDTNFFLRTQSNSSDRALIDHIQVKVYYEAFGGQDGPFVY